MKKVHSCFEILQGFQENQRPSFTNEEIEEVRRAYAQAEREQQDNQHTAHMMMTASITEQDAQNEDETVALRELGERQIGEDPEEVRSALIDNEAGTEERRPSKKQRTQNLFDDEDDDADTTKFKCYFYLFLYT